MKKTFKTLSFLAFSLLALGACSTGTNEENGSAGSKSEVADDVVEINFFHRWPSEPRNSFFADKAAEFEEMKDGKVKINIDSVLNDSYKEKIRVLVSNDQLPDIFTSWSDSFTEKLVSSGRIKALDDIVAEDTDWSSQIMESQMGGFTVDNTLYGIPFTIDGKAWFYNTEIFKDNNLDVPKTYEELIDTLDKLQAAGYDTPLVEGLADPWTISHYLGTIFERLLDEDTLKKDYDSDTGEFTDSRYVEGLEMFQQLTEYMGDVSSGIDHETARNMFADGDVPIMYLQLAEIPLIEKVTDMDFDYFDFPKVKGGEGDQNALTGAPEGFMLSENASEEAVEFLKFLTSEQVAYDFTEKDGQLTAIEGGVTEENVSKQNYRSYQLITDATATVPWFDNAVDISIGDIFMRGGQSLAIGQTTSEDIMKEVQEQAATLRKE